MNIDQRTHFAGLQRLFHTRIEASESVILIVWWINQSSILLSDIFPNNTRLTIQCDTRNYSRKIVTNKSANRIIRHIGPTRVIRIVRISFGEYFCILEVEEVLRFLTPIGK